MKKDQAEKMKKTFKQQRATSARLSKPKNMSIKQRD